MNIRSDSARQFVERAIACLKASAEVHGRQMAEALPDAEMPVVQELGNGLCVAFLVDEGDALTYVQRRHLDESGIDISALHKIGIDNLAERSNGKAIFKQYGDIFAVHFDDMFEASLLLLDDLWDISLANHAPNGFVAIVPARDMLGLCDAGNESGITQLRALADKVFVENRPHLLANGLFRRISGKWVSYK